MNNSHGPETMDSELPFPLHTPNEETKRVLVEALAGKNLHTAKDADDLFAQLETASS